MSAAVRRGVERLDVARAVAGSDQFAAFYTTELRTLTAAGGRCASPSSPSKRTMMIVKTFRKPSWSPLSVPHRVRPKLKALGVSVSRLGSERRTKPRHRDIITPAHTVAKRMTYDETCLCLGSSKNL